jgi:hypothetical protein
MQSAILGQLVRGDFHDGCPQRWGCLTSVLFNKLQQCGQIRISERLSKDAICTGVREFIYIVLEAVARHPDNQATVAQAANGPGCLHTGLGLCTRDK